MRLFRYRFEKGERPSYPPIRAWCNRQWYDEISSGTLFFRFVRPLHEAYAAPFPCRSLKHAAKRPPHQAADDCVACKHSIPPPVFLYAKNNKNEKLKSETGRNLLFTDYHQLSTMRHNEFQSKAHTSNKILMHCKFKTANAIVGTAVK